MNYLVLKTWTENEFIGGVSGGFNFDTMISTSAINLNSVIIWEAISFASSSSNLWGELHIETIRQWTSTLG